MQGFLTPSARYQDTIMNFCMYVSKKRRGNQFLRKLGWAGERGWREAGRGSNQINQVSSSRKYSFTGLDFQVKSLVPAGLQVFRFSRQLKRFREKAWKGSPQWKQIWCAWLPQRFQCLTQIIPPTEKIWICLGSERLCKIKKIERNVWIYKTYIILLWELDNRMKNLMISHWYLGNFHLFQW